MGGGPWNGYSGTQRTSARYSAKSQGGACNGNSHKTRCGPCNGYATQAGAKGGAV